MNRCCACRSIIFKPYAIITRKDVLHTTWFVGGHRAFCHVAIVIIWILGICFQNEKHGSIVLAGNGSVKVRIKENILGFTLLDGEGYTELCHVAKSIIKSQQALVVIES